jgi:hypothetical protein
MHRSLRKILGVAGLSMNWSIVWGAFFALAVLIISVVRPQNIAPGEGPLPAGVTGLFAGLVSGAIFGCIVTIAEDRRPVAQLKVPRVALWGAFASAVWPLVNRSPGDMMLVLCLFGGAYAAVSVAVTRRFVLSRSQPSLLFTVVGRSVRDPLRAACAPDDSQAGRA